jgi:hypothetical protein
MSHIIGRGKKNFLKNQTAEIMPSISKYFFIYVLFYTTANSSNFMASKVRVMSE